MSEYIYYSHDMYMLDLEAIYIVELSIVVYIV